MSLTITAMFDGEVLRPDQTLDLRRNRSYSIIINDQADVAAAPSPVTTDAAGTRIEHSHAEDDTASSVNDAWRIYDDSLKALLEPGYVGQVVAIHPPSGDYAVGPNSPTARRALQQQHPGEQFVVIDIGVQPIDNPLSLRQSGAIRKGR